MRSILVFAIILLPVLLPARGQLPVALNIQVKIPIEVLFSRRLTFLLHIG